MADKLTPQQAQAVHDRGGKLLVSAAAGSGKTKVLVDRLMEYLTDPNDPADLDEFLIITYTKAAASELRGKIAAKLSERIAREPENKHLQKQMQRLFLTKISTVHGFCADVLREYAYRLDLAADFRVADENECRELRETVLADLLDRAYETGLEDPAFRAFVDTQGLGRDDRLVPQIIEKVYDSAKCHLDPEGWLQRCLENAAPRDGQDVSETPWGSYLMAEFQDYLACQLRVMDQCVLAAEDCPGLEKVAVNLKETCHQLRTLSRCTTWDGIAANRDIQYGRLTFPKKLDDPELAERIKAARNACKKGLDKKLRIFENTSQVALEDMAQSAQGAAGLIDLVRRFDKAYAQAKRSRRCLDFSDLEHRTLDLLLGKSRSHPTAAASELGSRFREIMVDEYQDSNGVQDAIFTALTQKRNNCFMVGDVKQSIYQFRLADPGIFLEKYHSYAPAGEAAPGEGRKVLLSHNFRSGGEVIEAVNHIFCSCMSPRVGGLTYGAGEALREGVPHSVLPDRAVELHALEIREDTYTEEAAYVARQIRQMLDGGTLVRDGDGFRPVTADDIVILLRSPGSVGWQYQQALEALGIHCTSGGGNDLLETQEIGTFRSLLQTVYNPRQDIPLVSTLASPVFGFTADDLAAFRSQRRSGSVYDALRQSEMPKAKAFLEILETLRWEARMHPLTKLLESCLTLTGMDSIYAAMEGGETRSANLQAFFTLASDFESGGNGRLGQFLEHLDALAEKGLITDSGKQAGCVTIMSIHKSKGLEFPVVFLGALSRSFNQESLRATILCDKELGLGLSVADRKTRTRYPSVAKRAIAAKMAQESLSEEMRVLYVALTRARDRLIMVYSSRNLEGDIQEIALRRDFDGGALLCRDASCPGDWVLKAAMERTEAGELFALGGRLRETTVSDIPWRITVAQAPEAAAGTTVAGKAQTRLPEGTEQALRAALGFRYGHTAATVAPSKQTATQKKGREKDEEAAQEAPEPKTVAHNWRKPAFIQKAMTGKEIGSANHAVMQYIRYEACVGEEGVRAEVRRLKEQGFLTAQQAENANCEAIAGFFETDIGRKLREGAPHLREFKFSILDDGEGYGPGLEGEKVLLQGVVDCALLEPDGITVLDFKTDRVTEHSLAAAVERYRPQVEAYGEALARIYEMPIQAKYLYFFHIGQWAAV